MDRRSNFIFFWCCLVFAAFILLEVFPSPCLAKKVTLGWDANPEPDLEGYVIYRNIGSPGPPFKYADELQENELNNPLNPQVALTGLNEHSRYYIAVTAYDTEGNESYFSDQLCVEIVDSSIESCGIIPSNYGSSSESSGDGRSGGGGGGGCFISSSAGGSGHARVMAVIVIIMLVVGRLLSVVKAKQRTTSDDGPLTELFWNWTQTRPPRPSASPAWLEGGPCLHGGQVNTDAHR
ncbi:MAG: fibronectin type III domain-containing protein [Desulfobacterales bacterium]